MTAAPPAAVRRWIATQIGAREHYGVPVMLHRHEALRLFYTDAWCRRGRRMLSAIPLRSTRALAGRFHPDLPGVAVCSFTMASALRGVGRSQADSYQATPFGSYLAVGEWFGDQVARELQRMRLDPGRDAFFAFNTGALEALRVLRHRGVFTVVDQVDAGRVHQEIAEQERRKWPGWDLPAHEVPEAYWSRLASEWSLADRVLVNSRWSRDALVRQGVPPEKLLIVPLAYESHALASTRRFDAPVLTVLWLGAVNLAKGLPYLLEAARLLSSEPVRFLVVGPIGISRDAQASAPTNVTFTGPVPRLRAIDCYRSAHLFVLPTLSDGFAITQLEAMAHGLPVIATPRCGEVVTDGIDGSLVAPGDSSALAGAILRLVQDRLALAEMSRNALRNAAQFTLRASAERFAAELERDASVPAPPASSLPVSSRGTTDRPRRWIVSQVGARQHYAVPIALHEDRSLRRLYTDAWCRIGRPLLARIPGRSAALAARYSPMLPSALVDSFTARAVLGELIFPFRQRMSVDREYRRYLRFGSYFGRAVARALREAQLDPRRDTFFGFTTGSLEVLDLLRRRGVFSVVDQVDAAQLDEQIVRAERRSHPGWEQDDEAIPQAYWDRLREEWLAADAVLVNSSWSRSALVAQGIPEEKIFTLPLAYEPAAAQPIPRVGETVTVLWMGTVCLRKGIYYLLEAARLLSGSPLRFVVAGPIRISREALGTAPPNVRFLGRVQRPQAAECYLDSDIFVLPTLSDGFALTQIEAMAHGLPVVTTPRCGEVVTHGSDGFIVPPGDSQALADALARLTADRALRQEMSRRAFETSRAFTRAAYARRLHQEVAQRAPRA